MVATPIAAATRFFVADVTTIVFATSISVISAVSRAEINLGTDLSNEVAEADGWAVNNNLIDAPDIGRRFTGQVRGRTEAEKSSLTVYQSITTSDGRLILPKGTTGFILIMWGGDVAGRRMDVYPVEVASVGKAIQDSKAMDMKIMFAITSEPAEDVVIPA